VPGEVNACPLNLFDHCSVSFSLPAALKLPSLTILRERRSLSVMDIKKIACVQEVGILTAPINPNVPNEIIATTNSGLLSALDALALLRPQRIKPHCDACHFPKELDKMRRMGVRLRNCLYERINMLICVASKTLLGFTIADLDILKRLSSDPFYKIVDSLVSRLKKSDYPNAVDPGDRLSSHCVEKIIKIRSDIKPSAIFLLSLAYYSCFSKFQTVEESTMCALVRSSKRISSPADTIHTFHPVYHH